MSILVLPKSIQQPNQAVAIAPAYRNGLKVLWTGAAGAGFQNLAPGGVSPAYITSALAPTDSTIGKALNCGATTNNGVMWQTSTDAATFTLLVAVQFYNTGATEGFFQWYSTNDTPNGGSPRILLQNNSGDIRYYNGSSYVLTDTGVGTVGSVHYIVMRNTPSECVYYRNGRVTSTTAPGTNSGNYLYFGTAFSTAARCFQPIGAWWEDDIGDARARELSVNPWAVFQAPARRLHLNAIAAAGSAIAVKSNYYRMMRGA